MMRRKGRPHGLLGDVSTSVLVAVKDLVHSGDCVNGVTWREVFERACLSRCATKNTINNLVRAGHLEVSGARRVAGIRKPLRLFVPRSQHEPASTSSAALSMAMFQFCSAR